MTPTMQPLTYHCPHCRTTVQARPQTDGEVVACPACRQPFKLDLPEAAPIEQPGVVLPPGVEQPQTQPQPEQPAAPDQPAPVAQPAAAIPADAPAPESPGQVIHVSMWRRYPLRCLIYVLGILLGVAACVWLLSVDLPWVALAGGAVVAWMVFRLAAWWLRMRNTTLTITDRRCVIEMGVFTREATEIGRADVTAVHIAQDTMMRLLNVGDLVIVTNNGSEHQVVIMAVPNPDVVGRMIAPEPPPPPEAAAPQATSAA